MQAPAVPLQKQQRVEDFKRAMGDSKPAVSSYLMTPTNIVNLMSMVMGKYLHNRKKPKTMIVLTDGRWDGLSHETAVDELIINNLRHLRTIHPDSAINGNVSTIEAMRPLTIQFVRFGQHPGGADRLRRLDDCLVEHGVEYVVHCVVKLLLDPLFANGPLGTWWTVSPRAGTCTRCSWAAFLAKWTRRRTSPTSPRRARHPYRGVRH